MKQLLSQITKCRARIVGLLYCECDASDTLDPQSLEISSQRLIARLVFDALAEQLLPPGRYESLEQLTWSEPTESGPTFVSEQISGTAAIVRTVRTAVQAFLNRTSDNSASKAPASTDPLRLPAQVHELMRRYRVVINGEKHTASLQLDSRSRKRDGVFYTPKPVVQYIANRAITRPICERAITPGSECRIVDPSCGGGLFLIEAVRRLLHETNDRSESGSLQGPLLADRFLTSTNPDMIERLTSSIFGWDIDPDAIASARRAVWLEAMRHLSDGLSEPEYRRIGSRLLSVVTRNIRVIDTLSDAVSSEFAGRIDAVIGNPPYLKERGNKQVHDRIDGTRLAARYKMARMDLWYYFVHRGLELLRPDGRMSLIVGAYWTSGVGAGQMIRELRDRSHVDELFLLERLPVFQGVGGRHMILSVVKRADAAADSEVITDQKTEQLPTTIRRYEPGEDAIASRQSTDDLLQRVVLQLEHVTTFRKDHAQLFRGDRIDLEPETPHRVTVATCPGADDPRFVTLSQLGDVRQGIVENPAEINRSTNQRFGGHYKIGQGVFSLRPRELDLLEFSDETLQFVHPYYDLCDLGRYYLAATASRRLIYSTRETCPEIDDYPDLRRHLQPFRPIMEARRETVNGMRGWWQLHWPRDPRLGSADKLLMPQMVRRPSVVVARGPTYVPFSCNLLVPHESTGEHLNYLAATLNSRPLQEWFQRNAKHRGVGLDIGVGTLKNAPIRRINFDDPTERQTHDELVQLVDQMQAATNTPNETTETRDQLDTRIEELIATIYR